MGRGDKEKPPEAGGLKRAMRWKYVQTLAAGLIALGSFVFCVGVSCQYFAGNF